MLICIVDAISEHSLFTENYFKLTNPCALEFNIQVVNLLSVDLLRQQPRWKEALVSLREMMTSLVQQV